MLFVALLSGAAYSQTDNDPIFNEFAKQELSDLTIDLIELRNGTLSYNTKKVIHIRRDNYIQRFLSDLNITDETVRSIGKAQLENRIPIIEDPRFHRRLEMYYSLRENQNVTPSQKTQIEISSSPQKTAEQVIEEASNRIADKREHKKRLQRLSGFSLPLIFILVVWFLYRRMRA